EVKGRSGPTGQESPSNGLLDYRAGYAVPSIRFALALSRVDSPFPSQSRNLTTLGRSFPGYTAVRKEVAPEQQLKWRKPLQQHQQKKGQEAVSPQQIKQGKVCDCKAPVRKPPRRTRAASPAAAGVFPRLRPDSCQQVHGKGSAQDGEDQLNLETGIPIYEAEPLVLFFILFTLLSAIGALGDRGSFVDDPAIGIEGAVIPLGKGLKSALGLREKADELGFHAGLLFEFTKANELFVGRLEQLGIAFSIIGEIITGKEALAQLNIETGVPISDIEPLVLFNVAFFFIAALNPSTGKFVTDV
ncbi:hypothetical protein Taro_054003, partial [Colocasia esculenta]|nr:hypothetical protein [Colocasia esculenta]